MTVWASRHEELLHDCVVSPHVFDPLVDRLRDFVVPYQHCLETEAGQRHVHLYLAGLLSHLERKNAEAIAAFVDVERLGPARVHWDRAMGSSSTGQGIGRRGRRAVGGTRWGDRL